MVYLDNLLKILRTTKLSICNQNGTELAQSDKYCDVEPYLNSEVVEISHDGYEFNIKIKYLEEEN